MRVSPAALVAEELPSGDVLDEPEFELLPQAARPSAEARAAVDRAVSVLRAALEPVTD